MSNTPGVSVEVNVKGLDKGRGDLNAFDQLMQKVAASSEASMARLEKAVSGAAVAFERISTTSASTRPLAAFETAVSTASKAAASLEASMNGLVQAHTKLANQMASLPPLRENFRGSKAAADEVTASINRLIGAQAGVSKSARESASAFEAAYQQQRKWGDSLNRGFRFDEISRSAKDAASSFNEMFANQEKVASGFREIVNQRANVFDGVTRSAKEASVAFEELFENQQRVARQVQSGIDTRLGISGGSRRSASEAAASFAGLPDADETRAKYNPLFEIGLRYRQEVDGIRKANAEGALSFDEMNMAIERAGSVATMSQQAYLNVSKTLEIAGGQAKLTTYQMTNLGYQVNDIATMFLMGASPFQIFASQAGQVTQALGDNPGGVRNSLAAIGGYISNFASFMAGPMGVAIGGVTAAAVGLAYVITRDVEPIEDVIERQDAAVRKLSQAYGITSQSAESYGARAREALRYKEQQNYDEGLARLQGEAGGIGAQYLGGRENQRFLVQDQFKPVRDAIERLQATAAAGMPDFLSFRETLTEIGKASPEGSFWTGDTVGDLARQILDATEQSAEFQGSLESLFDTTDEGAIAAAKMREAYKGAMEELLNLAPDARTEIERINDAFEEAMRNATAPGEQMVALFRRQQAVNAQTATLNPMLADARAQRATVGLTTEAAAIAEAERRYQELSVEYAGNADALKLLIDLRDIWTDTAREEAAHAARTKAAEEEERAAERAAQQLENYRKGVETRIENAGRTADALQLELDAYGQTEGTVASLQFRFNALTEAKRAAAGVPGAVVSEDEVAAIEDAALRVGELTDQLKALEEAKRQQERLLDFDRDISFRFEQLGRSDIDQRVAEQMRSVGLVYGDAANSGREAQLRYLETVEATNASLIDMGKLGADVFSDIVDAISEGKNGLDGFLGAVGRISQEFARIGIQKLAGNLFGTGPGGVNVGAMLGGSNASLNRPSAPVVASIAPRAAGQIAAEVAAPAAAAISGQVLSYAGRFNGAVDGRLMKILETAASRFPLQVEAISGLRPGDRRFHGKGLAADVQIYGANGQKYGNYQNAGDFRIYEQFAQQARIAQQQLFPELDKLFRWGGYFSGGKGKYGALDSMHFDLGGAGMGGGSWANGLTANQRRLWAGAESIGMGAGSSPMALRSAVRDGSLDATRALASGSIPTPTARPMGGGMGAMPQAGGGMGGARTGLLGGLQNFMNSPMGQGAMNAFSAFAGGMQSGSPIGGALNGGLAAFGMGLGPVGIGLGVVGGLLGGIFGRSKRKREERRQRQEQERQQMLQAQQQLDQQLPAILELQDVLLDRASGTLTKEKARIESQLKQYEQLAATAKNTTEQARIKSMQENVQEYMDRLYAEVRLAADSVVVSLTQGRGLDSEFSKAVAGIRKMSLDIRNYLADLTASAGEGAEVIGRATVAGREQLLKQLSGQDEVTEVYTKLDAMAGTAAQLGDELQKLGLNAEQAAASIREHLAKGIQKMRDDFVRAMADETANGEGIGHAVQLQQLLERRNTMRADAVSLGADPALIDRWFTVQARNLLDQAGIVGDALAPLVKAFPELAGVVGKSMAEMERSVSEAESNLKTSYDNLKGFIDQLSAFRTDIRLDRNTSTLGPLERLKEAQDRFREVSQKAADGDAEAQAELINVSRGYLDAARSYYASSEQYFAIFREVESILASTESKATAELELAKSQYAALLTVNASILTIPVAIAQLNSAMAARDQAQGEALQAYVKALNPQAAIPSYQQPSVNVNPNTPAQTPVVAPPPAPVLQNVRMWNGSSFQNYVGEYKSFMGRTIFVPSGWAVEDAWQLLVQQQNAPREASPGIVFNEKRDGGMIGYQNGGRVANGMWDRDSVVARHANGGRVKLAGGEGILHARAMQRPGVAEFMEAANNGTLPSIAVPQMRISQSDQDLASQLAAVRAELRSIKGVLVQTGVATIGELQEGNALTREQVDNIKLDRSAA